MLFNLKLRTQYLAQLTCVVTLGIFFLSATGCGKKSDSKAPDKSATTDTAPAGDKGIVDVKSTAPIIQASATPAPQTPVVQPVPSEVSFDEAEAVYQSGNYERSVTLFEVYVNNHDNNPWGHYMLGLSALKSGDTELALTAFNNSLSLDSTHVKSWLNMSRALLDEYRTEEALVSLEQVFELEPESSEAYRLKGRSLHALGRLEEAADAYRDALRIDDRDVWSMNNLALILMEQEHFELAIPSLARATQIRDDIAFIYNNLGMALERTYRFRAAEEAYAAAVAIDAAHDRAQANLARVKGVTQDSGVEPVDLDRMAVNFIDEIQSWGDEYIDRELPLTVRDELANEL